jgi:uncharacterized membrane protein
MDYKTESLDTLNKTEKDILYEELAAETKQDYSEEHIKRVTKMVSDYKGKIKAHLNEVQEKHTTWPDRLADRIASFGGSWPFIIIFASFLIVWMIWNSISYTAHFDEHPFILLNLILSCLAAFQAPVILMSQNREMKREKEEALMDFAINYKAEQENLEITRALERIEQLLLKNDLK